MRVNSKNIPGVYLLLLCLVFLSCQAIRTTYDVAEGTVKTTYKLSNFDIRYSDL